jgi:hypothetical protein
MSSSVLLWGALGIGGAFVAYQFLKPRNVVIDPNTGRTILANGLNGDEFSGLANGSNVNDHVIGAGEGINTFSILADLNRKGLAMAEKLIGAQRTPIASVVSSTVRGNVSSVTQTASGTIASSANTSEGRYIIPRA